KNIDCMMKRLNLFQPADAQNIRRFFRCLNWLSGLFVRFNMSADWIMDNDASIFQRRQVLQEVFLHLVGLIDDAINALDRLTKQFFNYLLSNTDFCFFIFSENTYVSADHFKL